MSGVLETVELGSFSKEVSNFSLELGENFWWEFPNLLKSYDTFHIALEEKYRAFIQRQIIYLQVLQSGEAANDAIVH